MALFSHVTELRPRNGPVPLLQSCHFVASASATAALAESGHLALSAPSQIMGRFQALKTLYHPHLCEYIEIHRGKHDRLFVVAEHYPISLQTLRNDTTIPPSYTEIQQWGWEALTALLYLHDRAMLHACLSPQHVLIDPNGHVKLAGYGLHTMTGGGTDVDFPLGYPSYLAPECVFREPRRLECKQDCWALAVILLEQYLDCSFWTSTHIGDVYDALVRLFSLGKSSATSRDVWNNPELAALPIDDRVITFLTDTWHETRADLQQFFLGCLDPLPQRRLAVHQVLSLELFRPLSQRGLSGWARGPALVSADLDPDRDLDKAQPEEDEQDPLAGLPLAHIYHLWRLAGGDVELDFAKRGLSTPVIERLPRVCLPDRTEIGRGQTDVSMLYSDEAHVLDYTELYQRLERDRLGLSERLEWDADYFSSMAEADMPDILGQDDHNAMSDFIYADPHNVPSNQPTPLPTPTTPSASRSSTRLSTAMSHSESSSSLASQTTSATTPSHVRQPKQPLSLREQDVAYQYHRQRMFLSLLRQYPSSHDELLYHARVDIPPLLRGPIWAAVLGVHGYVVRSYDLIDKYTDKGSDRQIDVDVPRCHQYNPLLASLVGHQKLRRLLKAWVAANDKQQVYWQGLDSLCAPFLTLHFNDEPLAFACLQKFIPKFLDKFFMSDNHDVLQEYLAVFRHLLSFHDPELSAHLNKISFAPDLYAITWFLTLFTHLFPLDKIYPLWDKLAVGPPTLPLFAGTAILRQIRDKLLDLDFNDCITLFSDKFPKVEIEKCVHLAMSMYRITPPSVVMRVHGPSDYDDQDKSFLSQVSLETRKRELAPRLSVVDLAKILPWALVLDLRTDQEFAKSHVPSSMHVKAAELQRYASILRKLNRKYHIVLDHPVQEGPAFAAGLVYHHFSRVALLAANPTSDSIFTCNCRPKKQTTAGLKGKGSEPPFVIWRCCMPTPLKRPPTASISNT